MHFSFINWEYLLQSTIQIAGAIEGTTRVFFGCQVIEKSVGRHCLGTLADIYVEQAFERLGNKNDSTTT